MLRDPGPVCVRRISDPPSGPNYRHVVGNVSLGTIQWQGRGALKRAHRHRVAGAHQMLLFKPSFRSVGACHMDNPIVVSTGHADAPWIAAHLAILNEAAMDVRLDVDFHLLAAKRTRDQKLVWHSRNPIPVRQARFDGALARSRAKTARLPNDLSVLSLRFFPELFGRHQPPSSSKCWQRSPSFSSLFSFRFGADPRIHSWSFWRLAWAWG